MIERNNKDDILIQIKVVVFQNFPNERITFVVDGKSVEVGIKVYVTKESKDYFAPLFVDSKVYNSDEFTGGYCYIFWEVPKSFYENGMTKFREKISDCVIELISKIDDKGDPFPYSYNLSPEKIDALSLACYLRHVLRGGGAPESFKEYDNEKVWYSFSRVITNQGINRLMNLGITSHGLMLCFDTITIGIESDGYAHS